MLLKSRRIPRRYREAMSFRLAAASSPAQIMQLQMDYWDERLKALVSQAQELRALSADLVAKTNEPIREHMRAKRGNTA